MLLWAFRICGDRKILFTILVVALIAKFVRHRSNLKNSKREKQLVSSGNTESEVDLKHTPNLKKSSAIKQSKIKDTDFKKTGIQTQEKDIVLGCSLLKSNKRCQYSKNNCTVGSSNDIRSPGPRKTGDSDIIMHEKLKLRPGRVSPSCWDMHADSGDDDDDDEGVVYF